MRNKKLLFGALQFYCLSLGSAYAYLHYGLPRVILGGSLCLAMIGGMFFALAFIASGMVSKCKLLADGDYQVMGHIEEITLLKWQGDEKVTECFAVNDFPRKQLVAGTIVRKKGNELFYPES